MLDHKEIASRALFRAEVLKAQREKKKKQKQLMTAAALMFSICSVTLVIVVVIQIADPQKHIFIEDEQPPLAAPSFGVTFPEIDRVTVPGTETLLKNPESNSCRFTFEITLDGETLYQSGMVEPGATADKIILIRDLPKGEYKAELVIRAYEPDGMEKLDETNAEIILTVP